jgi:hypothetical protein
MKNKIMILGLISFLSLNSSAYATRITTGTLANSTTAASSQLSNIGATPSGSIRFDVGGANFITSSGQLTISIGVDAIVPAVTTGTAANQLFRDDIIGAAYFGYYLSTGVKSASQAASGINIKIKKGTGETSGRSYYLLGNGTTTPVAQGDLTIAPASFTTFASTVPNSAHCGPKYTSNGLTGGAINCAGGSTVANMDVTQFVKVLDSDPTSAAIISQLEFIAVNE